MQQSTKRPTDVADRAQPILMPRTTGTGAYCLVSGSLKGLSRFLKRMGYPSLTGQPSEYCRVSGSGWTLALGPGSIVTAVSGDTEAAYATLRRLGLVREAVRA
jgi:hypothetical protein